MSKHPVRPVTVSGHIPASVPEVLAFISDTRNDPLWCPNVDSAVMTSEGAIGIGSTFRYTQHLDRPGADRVRFDGEVEVLDLTGSSIEWRVTDRFQERTISCTVEPDGAGARVKQTTRARFHRSPGLAGRLYPLIARRTLRKQLAELRHYFAGR